MTIEHRNSILAFFAAVVAGSLLFSLVTNDTQHSLLRIATTDGALERSSMHRQLENKSSQFTDPKTVAPRIAAPLNMKAASAAASGPNIIYIQHESLSGSLMLNTDDGAKAMPFFQDMMHNDPNMFVFEHTRTGSGNTIDALPSLMTGCLPHSKQGADWVHTQGTPIGYDFSNLGYRTASFSSRALDSGIVSGQWKMLYDMLAGGMDRVIDPLHEKWPMDNSEGSDDRRMLPLFEEWLADLDKDTSTNAASPKEQRSPFYAQFYNFNQHYPYLKDPKYPAQKHKYYDSLLTTDEFLKNLFEILEKTGRLDNTIIVGSGDHGEDPFKGRYARLYGLNSNILHAASYIYYPGHLMPDEGVADRLRRNTQKLTYTLDLYPTIQSIVQKSVIGTGDGGGKHPEGCISGVDLTTVDIPDDRVVISWDLVSSNLGLNKPRRFWALSTKELSLYHRKNKKEVKMLKQGKDNAYILMYGDCTRDTAKSNMCMASLNEEYKAYFRGAIQWIKDTPSFFGGGVKTSELVEFFSEMVGEEVETAVG